MGILSFILGSKPKKTQPAASRPAPPSPKPSSAPKLPDHRRPTAKQLAFAKKLGIPTEGLSKL